MQVNSRCIYYKNNSTGWQQYDPFSIQHSNGHRHKTPAIARYFTFYTTVSPPRRKYMEERRERVIRLSSDSTSFLQNCLVGYFGEQWSWQKRVRFSEACYGFSQKEQGSNKCCREAQLCYGRDVEEVVDQRRKLVTFEERAVAAQTSFAQL